MLQNRQRSRIGATHDFHCRKEAFQLDRTHETCTSAREAAASRVISIC
jgi:hypothetical protein